MQSFSSVMPERFAPSGAEVLRCAIELANTIKRLHDEGRMAGDLDPGRLRWAASEVLVDPVAPGAAPGPWSAPERWEGKPADAASDIYSYGAAVYTLAAVRPPFAAAGAEELRRAVLESEPAAPDFHNCCAADVPLYSGLYRIAAACLAKRPEQRPQRIQKIQMELRLLQLGQRQEESRHAGRREYTALRAEIAAFSDALAPRLEALESAVGGMRNILEAIASEVRAMGTEQQRLAEVAERHAAALDVFESAGRQTDEAMERLMELFGTLQNYVLERAANV